MSIPDAVRTAIGAWNGTNRLYFPGEPTRDVESSAVVALAAQEQWSTISYTWSFDGQPQDGLLLVGKANDQNAITAVWIDSWHMGDKVMQCLGQQETDNHIIVRGSYKVEDSPDWGWRIDVLPARETLHIVMYNVSPEGEESLAVEASYTRATNDHSIAT